MYEKSIKLLIKLQIRVSSIFIGEREGGRIIIVLFPLYAAIVILVQDSFFFFSSKLCSVPETYFAKEEYNLDCNSKDLNHKIKS